MADGLINHWLLELGYAEHPSALFRKPGDVPPRHRYAPELRTLLDPTGPIRAQAIFEVDGTPTVAFVESEPGIAIESIRQRIWNQNLVTVILEVSTDQIRAFSPQPKFDPVVIEPGVADTTTTGPWSAGDMQSGDILDRVPEWFGVERRVDMDLLENLGTAVRMLREGGISRDAAQYLIGQVLFVSYLEHRGIVGDTYRRRHGLERLHLLIESRNCDGLARLFTRLKEDFNGDFLDPTIAEEAGWSALPPFAFAILYKFLARVNLETGQTKFEFWNYDFRFIPVELLSGIYETFLGEEKDDLGAFYTPRHLAQLAVDFAFENSVAPAAETIYDGACGSGILLTTAFRRMLGHAHAASGRPLTLAQRIVLLKERIFGSDLSEPACRVTAFSLYLSLLEDLVPNDISELTADPRLKLPPLLGFNLHSGNTRGDFFSDDNPFAGKQRFSILISNPPWREAKTTDTGTSLLFEEWAKKERRTIVRRQIAAAFAHRAGDCLNGTGRLVLILPVSLLLAPTSGPFLADWLVRTRPERVVNFGDLRRQIFAKANHGCVVAMARPRNPKVRPTVPVNETFEYWTPKTDVSLAFGRLTLHTSDRAKLQTQAIIENNAQLRHRAWGSGADERLLRRLAECGTLHQFCLARGWTIGKGFNRSRHNSEKLDPAQLRKMPYLDADKIPRDHPVLPNDRLEPFPASITSVVSFGSQDGIAFHGARVLFPDGISRELEMRAVFATGSFCFKHTITAIGGPSADEDLLRFLAIYLRSPLARYLILHTAYSPANERERITVREVESLPLAQPKTPAQRKIVAQVAAISRELEKNQGDLLRPPPDMKKAYSLVEEYMELDQTERHLVDDITRWALPSRQSGSGTQATAWQAPPSDSDIHHYADALQEELERWRDACNGKGSFTIKARAGRRISKRGVGIVEIEVIPSDRQSNVSLETEGQEAVAKLIDNLAEAGVLPMAVGDNLFLCSDVCILHGTKAYFVKPLVRRLWRTAQAVEDADRLVREVSSESSA